MNIQELEHATRFAWPAIEEIELDGGVLRFANGVSRRSNAMIPAATGKFCPETLISEAEKFYSAKGQAAVVKVLTRDDTPAGFVYLDAQLEQDEYLKESPTSVLGLYLEEKVQSTNPPAAFRLAACARTEWVKAWHSVRGFQRDQQAIHCQLVNRIASPVQCLVLNDQYGNPCATGMAVLSSDTLGIFGMATLSKYHGRGFANCVLAHLLNWGVSRNAVFAYLQVEDCNLPALNLYKKFGFSRQYSYWYRVKDLGSVRRGNN